MSGLSQIAEERERQVIAEGYTSFHDDEHHPGDLVAAAHCYALVAWTQIEPHCGWTVEMRDNIVLDDESIGALTWPWDENEYKPSDDPIRNLVKAGALIAAELDRLQRAQRRPESGDSGGQT